MRNEQTFSMRCAWQQNPSDCRKAKHLLEYTGWPPFYPSQECEIDATDFYVFGTFSMSENPSLCWSTLKQKSQAKVKWFSFFLALCVTGVPREPLKPSSYRSIHLKKLWGKS